MIAFLKRWQEKRFLASVYRLIDTEDEYEFDTELIGKFYRAVEITLERANNDVTVRSLNVGMYRKAVDLNDSLGKINGELSEEGDLENSYNLQQEPSNVQLDEWLVDETGRRIDYYYFMSELKERVNFHVSVMNNVRGQLNKVRSQTLRHSLYMVHHDLLSLAEVHLRHYR